MALSTEEKDILRELKAEGYSFSDAMGFIASNRMNSPSKVAREKLGQADESAMGKGMEAEPVDTSAGADLRSGWERAKAAVPAAMDRMQVANQRESFLGRTSGKLAAGFRFAGDALSSLGEGAIRALPGGTKAMDVITEKVGAGAKKVAESGFGQSVAGAYREMPEGVRKATEDVGNIIFGGLGIAGAVATPGLTTSLTKSVINTAKTGFKNIDDAAVAIAESGITKSGKEGLEEAFDLGVNAENLMQRVARVSKGKQAKFEERAGESVGQYLVSRNVFGTPDQIADQLVDRMRTYKARVDRELATIEGLHRAPQIKTALDELNEIDAKVSTIGAEGMDSARIAELTKKHRTTGLTLSEVNEVKRLYERNVKVNYLNPGNPKPENLVRANNIDSALRSYVERKAADGGFTNIKELNRETYLAKQLADDLAAEFAGKQGNNLITLTDWVLLAEAANSPTAAAGFIGKKIFGSETVMSATARAIAKNKGIKQNLYANRGPVKTDGYLEFLKKQGMVEDTAKKPVVAPNKEAEIAPVTSTAQQKITDITQFKRDASLSPENKAIEEAAFNKILADEDGLLEAYKTLEDSKGGKVINTDSFRRLFIDVGYKGTNAAAVQEPASYLAKRAYTEGLKNNPGDIVVFTAGGSGTGKSTALRGLAGVSDEIDRAAVVLDSNLSSLSSAVAKIKEAEAAGKGVVIDYVYRDPLESFEKGVVKRMLKNEMEMGRLVPTKVVADNHINSLKVAKELEDMGIRVNYVDNSFGDPNKVVISDYATIASKANYPSVKELTDRMNEIAKRLLDEGDEGTITPEQYEGYIQ